VLTALSIVTLTGALSWMPATAATPKYDEYPWLWAGHQVSYGEREIPFRGTVVTRVDSLVLARVKMEGSRLMISQVACAVRFDEVAGVRISMDADKLPRARMNFELQADGETFVAKSLVSWDDADIDGDGHPGMTIGVDAAACDGDLYVSNRSRTRAEGQFDPKAFRGSAKVKVVQEVLGANGRCLGVVARDTDEVVSGPFAYVGVPLGTTCESLISSGWPIDAES
jgi:hypothetical protein